MSGSPPDGNSTLTTTTASTHSNLMPSTVPSPHSSDGIVDPFNHVGDGIFLQTNTAQGLAGICVWVALFLTCQQVNSILQTHFYYANIFRVVIVAVAIDPA